MSEQLCECGSGKAYMQCCGEYHQGLAEAPNIEALLRSRYCAYVHNDDAYLNRTWHPSTRPTTPMAENPALKWRGLEIIEKQGGEPGDSQGTIEFVARFTEAGAFQQLHERSRFVCEAGRWLYMDGDDLPPLSEVSDKVGRNDPCPCGSGKKFKKCCGA